MNFRLTLLASCASFLSAANLALAQTEPTGSDSDSQSIEQPTHSVPGFDDKLFDPKTAQYLTSLIEEARTAISACDEGAYNRVYSTWRNYVANNADGANDANVSTIFLPSPSDRDAMAIGRNRDAFPDFPADCNKSSDAKSNMGNDVGSVTDGSDQPGLAGSIKWTWESLDVPFDYLGYEISTERYEESAGRQLSVVEGEEELSSDGVAFDLDIPYSLPIWGNRNNRPTKVSVSYSEGDLSVKIGTVAAPPLGARTLLPGPDGGLSGASIGNAEDFSTEISNAQLDVEMVKWYFYASTPLADREMPGVAGQDVHFDLYTAYRDIDWIFGFMGEFNGYDGSFSYHTEIEQSVWDLHLSAETRMPIGSIFELKLNARGGPSLYDFDATDTLNFNFFNGATTGGGTSESRGDAEFKLGYQFGAELVHEDFILDVLDVGAYVGYGNEFVPSAFRDGDTQTIYEMKQTERTLAGVLAKIKF